MKLQNINIQDYKFAFLTTNRNITRTTELTNSIKEKGVLVPIIVISANELKGITLYSATEPTKELNEEEKVNRLVVLDGQHRLTSLLKIEQEKKKNRKASDSQEFESEISIQIPVIIKSVEEIGNINEYIITINNTSRKWSSKDYIDNSYKIKGDNNIIRTINAFKSLGFSISSTSRYMCLNKDALNAKTLAEYTNSNTEIKYINHERAIRIYKFLLGKGFSDNFLKKRYLVDYIAEEKKQSDNINIVLNKINYLRHAGVINTLKDNVIEKIGEIIEEDYTKAINEADENERKAIEKTEDYLSMVDMEDVLAFLDDKKIKKCDSENMTKKEEITESISGDDEQNTIHKIEGQIKINPSAMQCKIVEQPISDKDS